MRHLDPSRLDVFDLPDDLRGNCSTRVPPFVALDALMSRTFPCPQEEFLLRIIVVKVVYGLMIRLVIFEKP